MNKQETPIHNSPFSDEELEQFEEMLNKEQKESEKKVSQYEDRLEELESNMDDNSSSSAHHQGNIGTTEDEREKYYIMIEKEKGKQEEINMALNRIETGTYGICNVTGKPIKKDRLLSIPYAKYSIKAKKENTPV